MYGTILMINRAKGYGFIKEKHFENNLFFHRRNVSVPFDGLKEGQFVEYEVSESLDRKRNRIAFVAVNVRPVQERSGEDIYDPFNDPSSDLFNCDGCSNLGG